MQVGGGREQFYTDNYADSGAPEITKRPCKNQRSIKLCKFLCLIKVPLPPSKIPFAVLLNNNNNNNDNRNMDRVQILINPDCYGQIKVRFVMNWYS
jgi:hypothetical protein